MFGSTSNTDACASPAIESTRPVSWHPGCSDNAGQYHTSPSEQYNWNVPYTYNQQPHHSHTLSSYNSGYPIDSSGNSTFATSNPTPAIDSYASSPTRQEQQNGRNSMYRLSGYSNLDGQAAQWSVPDWVQMTQARSQSSTSSPITLPIQVNQEAEDGNDNGGKELVGMGLYDPPEGYNSWFSSGIQEGTGKGLKLEETWEPPPETDDDESEDESDGGNEDMEEDQDPSPDDASSDEASIEDPVPASAPNTTGGRGHPAYHNGKPYPVNMSGQSFLFGEDESLQNEWWYQPLTSSNLPATKLGYGWI